MGKCVRGDETNLFVKGTGEITNQTNEIGKYNHWRSKTTVCMQWFKWLTVVLSIQVIWSAWRTSNSSMHKKQQIYKSRIHKMSTQQHANTEMLQKRKLISWIPVDQTKDRAKTEHQVPTNIVECFCRNVHLVWGLMRRWKLKKATKLLTVIRLITKRAVFCTKRKGRIEKTWNHRTSNASMHQHRKHINQDSTLWWNKLSTQQQD